MNIAMSPRHVAVFDVGKTNAKLVVVETATGHEIAVRRMANRVLTDGPYPHYDTDALWSFLVASLKEVATDPGFDAISVTTHGAAAALLAADGTLALPVLDYEYEYPAHVRADYDRLRPDFSETFSPRLAMGLNLGAQIHYQKQTFPENFARVATIVTYAQYWSGRLTGVWSNEVTSLGCHTDLWNPASGAFSSLVGTLGLTALMPPVRSAFDRLGPLDPDIAREIGLAAPVPVHCGLHDSNASLLPHLIGRNPPFCVVSTGTWVISFGVGGDLARLDPARDTLANVDAYGRTVPSARFMGGREYEMLSAEIEPANDTEIEAALSRVLVKGMMLLPNVVSGSGPFPQARRAWRKDEGATAAERRAAVALYLALMTQASLSLLNTGGPILVEGPFAANRLYLAALSTVSGKPVVAVEGATGTAQGAALLAGAVSAPRSGSQSPVAPLALGSYKDDWHAAVARQAGDYTSPSNSAVDR